MTKTATPTVADLAAALEHNPLVTQAEAARMLGVERSNVLRHTTGLVAVSMKTTVKGKAKTVTAFVESEVKQRRAEMDERRAARIAAGESSD